MAGGFRSPAVVIGYSGSASQGGYYTLPWWQAGGGGGVNGGYITLPWWQAGGGANPEVQVKGGKKRRRILHLGTKRKELPLGSDELLPEVLSDLSKEAIVERKVEVDGVTVETPAAPIIPTLELGEDLTPLELISDSLEREIAQLVRYQEQVRYAQALRDFREDALRFDEEFLLLLLLMLD